MKRYLLFFYFIICNDILCQRINNQNGLSINVVNKIDFSSGFDATDNQIGNLIIRNIENRGLIFSDKNRYYISISFGWKYKRSTELKIDNYKGFIIDKNNDDKVIAEFSISNIKDVNKSIDLLVDNLISNNELVGELELVKFLSTWALFSVPLIIYVTFKAISGRNSKNK